MQKPFLQQLLERIVVRMGAEVIFADQFGYAGYVQFQNGRRAFFKATSFDLNPQGASQIAADKDYTTKLLAHMGYRVPQGILVFSPRYRSTYQYRRPELYEMLDGLERAVEFARQHGFPVVYQTK